MTQLVMALVFIVAAVLVPPVFRVIYGRMPDTPGRKVARAVVQAVLGILAVFMVLSTSYVIVEHNQVGHLKRIYLGSDMAPGRIVAVPGEKGPQAEVLPPGFHFRLFVRVLFEFEEYPVVTVPEGRYAILTAKDGHTLREGQYLADAWPEGETERYLDALYFMGDGQESPRGQKGPQLTVLSPGEYRINRYLFDVDVEHEAIDIPAGFVGVVKSNVGEVFQGESIVPNSVVDALVTASRTDDGKMITRDEAHAQAILTLSVPLVPKGSRGVWVEVLTPGRYYFNEKAYQVTTVDTRIQTWQYTGGFKRRWVDLELAEDGRVHQKQREEEIPVPDSAADKAVVLRVEGWDVFLDSRILVQITPGNAPYVVASVGGMQQVEDKIISPTYRSVLRNVAGGSERKVLDLLYKRQMLEKLVEDAIIPEGMKAGLIIREIRFGDPVVPPELLVPAKRKQLAEQMEDTFLREKEAQLKRIDTEKARAEANRQDELMQAQIRKTAAAQIKEEQQLLGEGEKLKLAAIAEGQKAQLEVLGKEKTYELAKLKMILDAVVQNPDIVKVPRVMVTGEGGSLEGAAAVLGASTLTVGLLEPGAAKAEVVEPPAAPRPNPGASAPAPEGAQP
jgi:regulator of protease activity HflC (stomatin/prohibitin superfamily)